MNKKLWKHFLQTLLISTLFMLVVGGVSVSAAKKTGFVTENGKCYYIKKDGTKQKGWLELKGHKYYFDTKTGVQLKGWAKDSSGKLVRYFTKGTGAMVTGFLTDSKGVTRYFDPKTGLLSRGFVDIKGNTYYFSSGVGAMATGWLENSKGQKRLFEEDGKMVKGWVKNTQKQYRYFVRNSGIMCIGLKKIGSAYYYFDKENGYRYQKGFLEIDGKTYYFAKSNGKAKTKWLELDGKKYYFGTSGVMYKNTTVAIDGKTYSFDDKGVSSLSQMQLESNNVTVYDEKNNRNYKMWKTYLDDPRIASGELTDLDLLAALCETEAGDQGHVGMVAVALCIMNRVLSDAFPSEVRYVIFQGGSFAQYSVVSNGTFMKRLNGQWNNRAAAYKAAKEALEMHDNYVKSKKPRTLKGFDRKDFNFMYFMMESSYWKQPLNFKKVDNFLYKDHMFFVHWES